MPKVCAKCIKEEIETMRNLMKDIEDKAQWIEDLLNSIIEDEQLTDGVKLSHEW